MARGDHCGMAGVDAWNDSENDALTIERSYEVI